MSPEKNEKVILSNITIISNIQINKTESKKDVKDAQTQNNNTFIFGQEINPNSKNLNKININKGKKTHFMNPYNLLNLNKQGFKYNITDLITDLIKFKIWKFNQKKLKPLLNKHENLNYFQKSEKTVDINELNNIKEDLNRQKNNSQIPINTFNVVREKELKSIIIYD